MDNPEVRVRWVLGFLESSVSTLRVGALLDTWADVVRYLLDRRVVVVDKNDVVALVKKVQRDRRRPTFVPEGDVTGTEHITEEDMLPLERPLLQELQDTLLLGLRTLDSGKDWVPDFTPPKLLVRRWERHYFAGPLLPVLVMAALDLLTQFGPQIQRCQCGVFFLPRHGHQKFHSPKCSAVLRQQNFHATHKRDYVKEEQQRARREGKRSK